MLWQRVESEGLAHYSYLLGDGGEAAVIDPRRDVEVYERALDEAGYRLRFIFETHRHEDLLLGSVELADRTGAEIWHADGQLEYQYGSAVEDGREWGVGRLRLRALATPGHTVGHMSYLLSPAGGGTGGSNRPRGAAEPGGPAEQGEPWAIFAGDCLFAGTPGRTDLLGKKELESQTRNLYHSLVDRLLPLGDGVLLCPAHGPGSACGGGSIADRPWTTLGLERRLDPLLQLGEEEFVSRQAKMHDFPPYFREMERRNLEGARLPRGLPLLQPLAPRAFGDQRETHQVLDVREVEAFGGAHLDDSIFVYKSGLTSFAGWFLSHDSPLLLVPDGGERGSAVATLVRIGYDRLDGYLAGGLDAWYTAGLPTRQIQCVPVETACLRWREDRNMWVLDVRGEEELESEGRIPDAKNIPIRHVLERLDEIPRDRSILIFCGSGKRSMVVASLLEARGWTDLIVVLGGIRGWKGAHLPVES